MGPLGLDARFRGHDELTDLSSYFLTITENATTKGLIRQVFRNTGIVHGHHAEVGK